MLVSDFPFRATFMRKYHRNNEYWKIIFQFSKNDWVLVNISHIDSAPSNLGEIRLWEVDYLPLNLSKLPILGVVVALT